MKDILKFGQYVRQIAEAQSRGDTKREKRLAQKGEEWFDIYGVPDYSAETGETVGDCSSPAEISKWPGWPDIAAIGKRNVLFIPRDRNRKRGKVCHLPRPLMARRGN